MVGKNLTRDTKHYLIKSLKKSFQLYLLMLLPLIYFAIFKYIPMYGAIIAFKDFNASLGIMGSKWIGFTNFERFFGLYKFWEILGNTLALSTYLLIVSFPAPIILALSINSCINNIFKKAVQIVTYAPHFISTVVLVGMVLQFLSPRQGLVNYVIKLFGGSEINFISIPSMFRSIYVWSDIWQNMGWNSIIYIAALAGVNPSLYEAAQLDGASRFKRLLYIDIPALLPTASILLILNFGKIMDIGFEKVFLMQNPLNLRVSEIISTYVYKVSLASSLSDYSYGAAVGLFNSVVNFSLILIVNNIAKKLKGASLW